MARARGYAEVRPDWVTPIYKVTTDGFAISVGDVTIYLDRNDASMLAHKLGDYIREHCYLPKGKCVCKK